MDSDTDDDENRATEESPQFHAPELEVGESASSQVLQDGIFEKRFRREEEGIEEFRVKIMSDLKTVRDKITQSMFMKEEHGI